MPIVNKMTVAGLGLPSAVASIQLIACTLVCVAIRAARLAPVDKLVWRKVKPYLIYVMLFIICLYSSIRAVEHANIETIIVFRSTAPLFVAALEWIFLGRALPRARSAGALLLIFLGSFLYVGTDAEFGRLGFGAYGWVTIYLFFICIQMAYGKLLLDDVQMDTLWGPVYYTNLLGIVPSMALGWTQGEFSDRAALAHFVSGLADPKLLASLSLSMVIGVGISWAGFNCRSLLSATSYTVVGVMNKVITVLIGQAVFESHAAWQGIMALMICVVGGSIYRQAPKRSVGVSIMDELKAAFTPPHWMRSVPKVSLSDEWALTLDWQLRGGNGMSPVSSPGGPGSRRRIDELRMGDSGGAGRSGWLSNSGSEDEVTARLVGAGGMRSPRGLYDAGGDESPEGPLGYDNDAEEGGCVVISFFSLF